MTDDSGNLTGNIFTLSCIVGHPSYFNWFRAKWDYVLEDLSIQGNVKDVRTSMEPCQLAMENGARRVLVPIENRRQFLEVSGDVAERLDPIFYGEVSVAANKALGIVH